MMQVISQNSSIDNNLLVAASIGNGQGAEFGGSITLIAPQSSMTNNRFQADNIYGNGFGGYLRLVAKENITLGEMNRTNGGAGGGTQEIFTEGDIINNDVMQSDARSGIGGTLRLIPLGGKIVNNGTIWANGKTKGGDITLTGSSIFNNYNGRIEASGIQNGTVVINGPFENLNDF